jgi:hypothetical protein
MNTGDFPSLDVDFVLLSRNMTRAGFCDAKCDLEKSFQRRREKEAVVEQETGRRKVEHITGLGSGSGIVAE